MCTTPWVPTEVIKPLANPATRLRGGVGSDKEWSDGSSSAHTAQDDSTVKIQINAPTQESLDEIDALSRPSTVKPSTGIAS